MPSPVVISATPFPNGQPRKEVKAVLKGGSNLRIASGIYWVRIEADTCLAEFPIAAFAGVTRIVPVSLRPMRPGESEEEGGGGDLYVSYGDAFMVDLPFDGMSIIAKMDNGRALATSVQDRRAFIDNVPAGRIMVSARGANFGESREVLSTGEHQVHILKFGDTSLSD